MRYRTISTNITHDIFSFRKTAYWCTVHMHCACNTVQLLWQSRLPFSWTSPPPTNSPKLSTLITRFRESYSSVSMSRESKTLMKSRNDWLNSGNALIQHLSEKMRFSCFPVLPGSAEAHVIWGGTVKLVLIAYFIRNISAKKISKCIHVCQSYSNSKVGRFLRHSVVHFFWLVNVCLVMLSLVFPYQAKRWEMCPKWPILCRVGRKKI